MMGIMHKVLDTPYIHYELQDDLLIGRFKKGLKITLDMAKEMIKARHEFTEYKPVVVLVYDQGVVSIDKKARDYLSSDEGVRGFIAGAFVLDSPFDSFLGNFFLKVSKPKVPAKVFSRTDEAMKWLEKFRK